MSGKPAKNLSEKVKFSQLRALVAVANTGNFSEAALQLQVSQSTVSHSIAALEDALGVSLIHRGRQKASLTPVGDRIFAQAQQVLALIDGMGQEAVRSRGIAGGQVRIAAFRSLASEVLPEAIAHLHERYDSIQVSITEFDNRKGLITALREGKADFVVADLLEEEDFESFLIMQDPFVALLPPNEEGNDQPAQALTWEDLRQQPLITSSSDCCRIILSYLKQCQPPLEVTYLIANDSTAVSMTRQGLGLSILPRLAAQPIPQEVRVAQLPFEIYRPLGISWPKAALLTPAAYAFLEVFKSLFQNGDPKASALQASELLNPGLYEAKQPEPHQAEPVAAQTQDPKDLDLKNQDISGAQRYGVEHEKATIFTPRHH
jgi:DNA-binding transcriptional LysR family regulator